MPLLGEPRTRKLNKRIMKQFEAAVQKHLRANVELYTGRDPDFDLEEWLAPGQLHLVSPRLACSTPCCV